MKVVSQNWIDNQKKQIRPKTHIRIKILETGKIYQTLSDYTGNVITLNDEDLYGFSYQSHVSPANEDLPYQKIQFDLLGIDYDFAKRIPCYVETSQYSGEWIGLGCGYFYLDEIRKDRKNNRTTLKFVDCVSTFTIKNRMIAISTPFNYDDAGFNAMHTALMSSDETHLPETLNFPNRGHFYIETDDSDISSYFTSGIANPNGFLNKTVAESLYLIAQACGGMLYINGSNWVRMNALDDPNYDERMYSIGTLEKCDFESQKKVKKVSVSRKKEIPSPFSTETIISSNEWQYNSATGKYYQSFDLDGIYYNLYYHTTGVDYKTMTNCWIYIESNTGTQTYSVGGNKGSDYSTPFFTTYTLDDDGEVNIDLELLAGSSTPTGTDGALELLKRVYAKATKFTTIVRFDTRFESGDFFTLEEGDNEFQCLLTDINFTYNGSLKATISGLIWELLPPVISNKRFSNDEDNILCDIYNPNDFDLKLMSSWSNVFDTPITIRAKETIHFTTANSNIENVYEVVYDYDIWNNPYDWYLYFEQNKGMVSDNVIFLKKNDIAVSPSAPEIIEFIYGFEDNVAWFDLDFINSEFASANIYVECGGSYQGLGNMEGREEGNFNEEGGSAGSFVSSCVYDYFYCHLENDLTLVAKNPNYNKYSDKTVVLAKNDAMDVNLTIRVEKTITDATNYSITIYNDSDWGGELELVYSDMETPIDDIDPHSSKTLTYSNFPFLSSLIQDYLNGQLAKPILVYLRNGKYAHNTSNNVEILPYSEGQYPQGYVYYPIITEKMYSHDDECVVFNITNPNNFDCICRFFDTLYYYDEYSFTIRANETIHFKTRQFSNSYANYYYEGDEDTDLKCQFIKSSDTTKTSIDVMAVQNTYVKSKAPLLEGFTYNYSQNKFTLKIKNPNYYQIGLFLAWSSPIVDNKIIEPDSVITITQDDVSSSQKATILEIIGKYENNDLDYDFLAYFLETGAGLQTQSDNTIILEENYQ